MTGKRSVLLSLSRLCGRVCIILLIAAGFVEHQLRVVHHGLLFTPNSEAETGVLSSAPVLFAEAGKATWAHDPPRRPQARPPAARPGLQGARAPQPRALRRQDGGSPSRREAPPDRNLPFRVECNAVLELVAANAVQSFVTARFHDASRRQCGRLNASHLSMGCLIHPLLSGFCLRHDLQQRVGPD